MMDYKKAYDVAEIVFRQSVPGTYFPSVIREAALTIAGEGDMKVAVDKMKEVFNRYEIPRHLPENEVFYGA